MVVGGTSSVRPEANAVKSAVVIDICLAGGVLGENTGALAENNGCAGCSRVGMVVAGVGIVVVVVVVVVMVVGVCGMVVVVGAGCAGGLFLRRPKRFRR